ncbi:conserved hypothetical protein [Fontimonas thermophila]|uniref:Purine nucleoside phosphorylase n=2 Tax=Fontimonas thermophila TaxID=1076937 RepID=A0A1I2IDC2_9GAMM|nr:conserved hypothetical protein [Fontimonas thermophila]
MHEMIGFEPAHWPAPTRVRAGQTLRTGGVGLPPYDDFNLASHVGDDARTVAENRRRLRAALRLPSEPVWLRQVHDVEVIALPCAQSEPQADAAWTATPGIVCAVLTADCLPVLFCADDGSAVAAAHAGWRGLAAGVLEATVAAMPVPSERIIAWMGAAIGPDAFEVGPEVRTRFIADDPTLSRCFVAGRGDRWFADLYALARARLRRAGVTAVYGGHACTYRDARRYFSYRRAPRCGRMATLIWITPA